MSSTVQSNKGISSIFFHCVHFSFLQDQERLNKVYLAMKREEVAVTYRPSPHRIRRGRHTFGTLPTPFLSASPKPTPLEMGQNVLYKQPYRVGPNTPRNLPSEVSRESTTLHSGHPNLRCAGPGTWRLRSPRDAALTWSPAAARADPT